MKSIYLMGAPATKYLPQPWLGWSVWFRRLWLYFANKTSHAIPPILHICVALNYYATSSLFTNLEVSFKISRTCWACRPISSIVQLSDHAVKLSILSGSSQLKNELPWPSGYELRLTREVAGSNPGKVIGGRQEGHPVQKMLTAPAKSQLTIGHRPSPVKTGSVWRKTTSSSVAVHNWLGTP